MLSKNIRRVSAGLALTGLLTISGLAANKVQTLNGDDVDAQELRSIIVEPFEAEPWVIDASPKPPESSAEIKIVPGRPQNLSYDEGNKNSLGVRYQFIYPGNRAVIIIETTR